MAETVPASPMRSFDIVQQNPQENVERGKRWMSACTKILFVLSAVLAVVKIVTLIMSHKNTFCRTTIVVDKSGRADFTTISAAVNAMPTNLSHRYCIKIKAGVYYKSVVIPPEKTNFTLVGRGADKTIIVSDFTNNSTATLINQGNGLVALDLTIRRVVGPMNNEGVALDNRGDLSVFYRCQIEGYHAVLSSIGKQFYHDCQIHGGPYTIYGDARVVFQKCRITNTISSNQTAVAIVGNTRMLGSLDTGFVFHLCQFSTNGNGVGATTTYLIGVETPYSWVVVMQSFIDGSIQGWIANEPSTPTQVFLAVFQNSGPGATITSLTPRLQIIDNIADASEYTVRVYLSGDTWLKSLSPVDLDIVKN